MFNNFYKSIFLAILLSFFFVPGLTAQGQGYVPVTDEPTSNSTPTQIIDYYTERLQTGSTNPNQNFDERLYEGDQMITPIREQLTFEQWDNYQQARRNYLENRQEAITGTGDYTPDNTNPFVQNANSAYVKLVADDRITSLDQEIADLNQQLEEDPTNQNLIEEIARLNASRETAQGISRRNEVAATTYQADISGSEIGDCFTWSGGVNLGNCILWGAGWVGTAVTVLAGSFLYLASRIFDLSIFMSIDMLGDWFNSDMVKNAWRVLRDFANLGFVFILLYIALGTIFDLQAIGNNSKKLVINVVIVALLVNFSGFFVRIVVDASNVVAYEFYSQMGGGTEVVRFKTIGSELVGKLRLDKYYVKDSNDASMPDPQIERLSFGSIIIQTFGNIIIILVTSFVLLVASILFIIRSIWLLLLYIVSPVALASYALPNNGLFKKWKNSLIHQSLYAPAFLIPLFIVFTLIGNEGLGVSIGANGGVLAGSLTLVLFDILILGLIIGCLFVAQTAGAIGLGVAATFGRGGLNVGLSPVKRFGGRTLQKVSGKIAETKAGEKLGESWNSGRLSRVRQSWDTGTLGDIKRSEFGQQTSKALSHPVASGVNTLSKAMSKATGVKGVENIISKNTFSQTVEAKTDKLYSEMQKIKSPAGQTQFIEGLAGFSQREEFKTLYSKLSPEDRAKIEKEAETKPKLLTALQNQRQNLRGKDAQDTALAIFKEAKGFDKLKAIEKLEANDFNAVYKNMKNQDRADIEKMALNQNDTKLKDKIETAKSKLMSKNPQEGKKTERIIKATAALGQRQPRQAPNQGDLLAKPLDVFNPAWAASHPEEKERINSLRNLTKSEFRDFMNENDLFNGFNSDIYPYLTKEQLEIIVKEEGANLTERAKIREEIIKNRDPNRQDGPHQDEIIEKAYLYLTKPSQGGIYF